MSASWKTMLFAATTAVLMNFASISHVSAEDGVGDGIEVPPGHEVATFAGGCFWCMETPFDKLEGVVSTTSGYTQGKTEYPTYEEVCTKATGHTEAVQIVFDPSKVTYEQLLSTFWHNINPMDERGQFCDKGDSYRSGIYYHNADQKSAAEQSRDDVAKELKTLLDGREIATEIKAAKPYYVAEEYHQDYSEKNPLRYHFYRQGCGRDAVLKAIWGEKAGK